MRSSMMLSLLLVCIANPLGTRCADGQSTRSEESQVETVSPVKGETEQEADSSEPAQEDYKKQIR